MAILVTLAFASPTVLRYSAVQDGNAGVSFVIPNAGGATPDLLTDALTGQAFGPPSSSFSLTRLMNAARNGYPPLPVGALDFDKANALLLGIDLFGAGVLTNNKVVYATTVLSPSDVGTGAILSVHADVDGSGNPTLQLNSTGGGLRAEAVVEIRLRVPGSG